MIDPRALPSYFFFEETIFLLLCAFSALRGNYAQKIAAALLFGQFAFAALIGLGMSAGVTQPRNWVASASDLILTASFAFMIAKFRNKWIVCITGFQLAELILNLQISLRFAPYDFLHVSFVVISGWLVVIALVAGVLWESGAKGPSGTDNT